MSPPLSTHRAGTATGRAVCRTVVVLCVTAVSVAFVDAPAGSAAPSGSHDRHGGTVAAAPVTGPLYPLRPQVAPTVSQVAPASLPQGAAHQDLVITGTGFAGGARVSFAAGAGVTVSAVRFRSAEVLVANVVVASDAPLATDAVTVTVGAASGTCGTCFAVSDTPSFSGSVARVPQGANDETVAVDGADFMPGAAAAFTSGSGTSIETLDVESPELIELTVTMASSASLGDADLLVVNPAQGWPDATCTTCVDVSDVPAVVRVTSLTSFDLGTDTLPDGATDQDLTVIGDDFMPGATVAFGTGVSAETVSYESPTELIVSTSVAPSAPLGSSVVTVTNPVSGSPRASCASCFAVSDTPIVVGASPADQPGPVGGSALPPGAADQDVDVYGFGFVAGAQVSFPSGSGVTVSATRFEGPFELVADVSVAATAAPGPLTLTVRNPTSESPSGSCATCLVVSTRPVLDVDSFESLPPGTSHVDETVLGADFMAGATVSFASGSGVTVNSVAYVSPDELVANLSVSSGAAPGPRAMTVTNPAAGSPAGSCAACFAVSDNPAVYVVTPSTVAPGASYANLTVVGADFMPGAAVSVGGAGGGVTVESVSDEGPDELIVSVSVSGSATPGARAVTVTTPVSGSASGSCATCVAVS